MAVQIAFIWIGQLKKTIFADPVSFYWKRVERYYRLNQTCLKDASGRLPSDKRVQAESQAIVNALGDRDRPICLDHRGQSLSSEAFARHLESWLQEPNKRPCFILGGAFGLSAELKNRAGMVLSLGPLTFPHEMARLVLLEQIYRAATILHNHPYHHS